MSTVRMKPGARVGLVEVPASTDGKVTVLLPVDLEDPRVDEVIREGIARRRILLATGECPCGATLDLAAAAMIGLLRRRGVTVASVVVPTHHEPGCPAARPELNRLLAAYARERT